MSRPAAPLPLEAATLRGAALRRTLKLSTAAWVFGSVWLTATSGAPIALFAAGLGASRFEFGLLSALPFLASLLSLPASLLTERTGARKSIFLFGLYTQRLLWVPIALGPLWIVARYGNEAGGVAVGLLLVLIFLMHCGQAVGGPAWTSWMADIVPDRVRGSYFSRRRQWGIVSALPTALLAGWVLDRYATPNQPLLTVQWCAIIFLIAAFFGTLDIHLFQHVPAVPQPPQSVGRVLSAMRQPLRNREFLFFAGYVATLVFAVSFMGQFVTLYLIEQVHVSSTGTQMMLLVVPMLAQLVFLPVCGKAVDRMGKKPVLSLASLGLVPVGIGWCFLGPNNIWLGYVLATLGTLTWTAVEVANFDMVLEMSASREAGGDGGGTGYVAVNNIIINISGCLGGLASGILAEALRDLQWTPIDGLKTFTFYDVLFILSGLMRLVSAVLFLPFLHEPAARPTHEALRFMTANIYNNLFNAILQPLRFVGVGRSDRV